MPISPRLSRAVGHYDPNNESEFRGDVDRSIKSLENQISLLRNARSNEFAKSALRENSIISDGSIDSYPDDFPAYFSGNLAIAVATVTFPAALAYTDINNASTGYEDLVARDFAEDGTTGEIEYTGVSTGKFLVQFSATFQTLSYNRYYFIYLRLLKKPDGGAFAAVPGATIHDNTYGNYIAPALYVYRYPRMLGAVIVELAEGDILKLQYGIDVIGTAMSLSSFGTATTSDGVGLVITNLDSE